MYIIANYEKWWRYPRTFTTFKLAFMIYEILYDYDNVIEYHDEDGIKIVWSKEMFN